MKLHFPKLGWGRRLSAPAPLPPRLAVDLFCGGAGGWGLGLHWAGVKVLAGVEKDPERAAAYAARWGVPVLSDVVGAGRIDFWGRTRPWLVCGSPPCKGISEVNHKGKGVDDDGLFFEAIRLGVELRPAWIALENVHRLRTRGADRVLEQLEAHNYAPRSLVVDSVCAGMDHARRRVFIVAADTSGGEGWPAGQSWRPPFSPPAGRDHIPGPGDRREGLGHLRADTLGRHLRAYDGVSARVAEFARHAYGDTLDPIFPYLIAKALIAWESGDVRGGPA